MNTQTRFRGFYFLLFAAGGGFGVFRNAYLREVGLAGSQIGVIGFLIPVVSLLSQPAWGMVSDRWNVQKGVLLVGVLVAGGSVLAYPLGAKTGFLALAVLTGVFACFRAPIRPVANSLVLTTGLDYGRVRAFGSISFGLAVLGVGVAVAWMGTTVVFAIYAAGMALAALVLFGIPVRESPPAESLGVDALRLVRDRGFAALIGMAFLMGTLLATSGAYFSIYMRVVGAGDAATGLALLLKTLGEVVVFVYAARIALSYRTLLVSGCLIHVGTFLVYAFVPVTSLVLAVQVALGFGFAGLYLSAVNLAHQLAPERIASTAQTLLTGLGFGGGSAGGQLLAGWLMEFVGIRLTYAYIAVLGLVAAVLCLAIDGSDVTHSTDG